MFLLQLNTLADKLLVKKIPRMDIIIIFSSMLIYEIRFLMKCTTFDFRILEKRIFINSTYLYVKRNDLYGLNHFIENRF